MTRIARIARVAGLTAVVFLLMPTAAHADYEDTDNGVIVTEASPSPGQPFDVAVVDCDSNRVSIVVDAPAGAVTIDGTVTTKATNPTKDCEAVFKVAIDAEGTFTITGYDQAGEVLGVQMVTVDDGVGPAGGSPDTVIQSGTLPDAGSDGSTTVLGVGGLLLLGAGVGVLLLGRRRRTPAA